MNAILHSSYARLFTLLVNPLFACSLCLCTNATHSILSPATCSLSVYLFFFNGPIPASFSFIFGFFKQTLQFLQQIYVNKCPSSIQCWDANPQPLERESLPITTGPGLPPKWWHSYSLKFSHS